MRPPAVERGMADPPTLAAFYASPCGTIARGLVRERLLQAWPACTGMSVLGLGYTEPYLDAWPQPRLAVAAGPGWPEPWPAGGRNRAALVEDDALPFPDLSFDRILLVHALETTDSARRLLREVWRVLRDDGQLLVVAPSRVGVWAHSDRTPFGQGQPYSHGQIGRLLTTSLFQVVLRDGALYVPPFGCTAATARVWERAGRRLMPHLPGVTITGAGKDLYAGVPLQPSRRRAIVLAGARR